MNLDLSSGVTRITKINSVSKTDYDLRYMASQEKFELSDQAFDVLGINAHALDMNLHPDGVILLTVVPDGQGEFKNQQGDRGKTAAFTNRKMRKYLNQTGLEDTDHFALEPVGKLEYPNGSFPTFAVVAWDERDESPLTDLLSAQQDLVDEAVSGSASTAGGDGASEATAPKTSASKATKVKAEDVEAEDDASEEAASEASASEDTSDEEDADEDTSDEDTSDEDDSNESTQEPVTAQEEEVNPFA